MISTSSATANTRLFEPSGVSVWVKRHPLFVYFVIAFGGTWLFFLPILLSGRGLGLLSIPNAAASIGFNPTIFVANSLIIMLNTGTQDLWFGFKVAAVVALVLIALTRGRLSYEQLLEEEKSYVN